MTKDEAMQMALNALNNFDKGNHGMRWQVPVIKALRAALANHCERCGKKLGTEVTDIHTCTPKEIQPVAWKMKGVPAFATSRPSDTDSIKWEALYAAPQKKEWVGLTEQEKKGIFDACEPD